MPRTCSLDLPRVAHLLGVAIAASLVGCGDPAIPIHDIDPADPVVDQPTPPGPIAIARGPRGVDPVLAGFSPDGRWLAWLDRTEAERTALHLLDIPTGREIRVANDVLTMSPRPVHFSADSAHIAYRTLDEDGSAVYDLGTLRVRRLADGHMYPVDVGVRRSSYQFTPGGQRLIGVGHAGLSVVDLANARPRVIAPPARNSVYSPAEVNLPVSPDGRWLAYMSGRALHVWDFEAARGRLLDDNALVDSLRFDGLGRFAFVSGTANRGRMHVVELEGPGRVVSSLGSRFAISANSRWIAYVSADGGDALTVLDTDGAISVDILVPGRPTRMRFSPDGGHLLIATRDEAGQTDLYQHALLADRTRLIGTDLVSENDALDGQFDPDGSRFVFAAESAEGQRSTHIVELESGDVSALGSGGCVPIFGSGVAGYGSIDAFGDACLAFSARHAFSHVRQTDEDGLHLVAYDAVRQTERVVLDGVDGPLRASPDRTVIVAHTPYDPTTRDRELVVIDLMHDRQRILAEQSRWYGALASDRHVAFVDGETIWLVDLRAPAP